MGSREPPSSRQPKNAAATGSRTHSQPAGAPHVSEPVRALAMANSAPATRAASARVKAGTSASREPRRVSAGRVRVLTSIGGSLAHGEGARATESKGYLTAPGTIAWGRRDTHWGTPPPAAVT